MADSLKTQQQMRESVQNFQTHLISMKNFEMEMKQNKNEEINEDSLANKNQIPVRSNVLGFEHYLATTKSDNTKMSQVVESLDNKEIDETNGKREEANQLKEKGNNFVKLKNYNMAIEMYTKAIRICPNDAVYYSNRSQCFLNLEKYKECIEDASNALKLDANSSKSYFRRMTAYEKLNQNMNALKNCQEWMNAIPSDQMAKNAYDRIHNKLIEIAKMKEKEKIKWSRSLEDTDFVDKALHNQSKRSLRSIDVRVKKSYSPIPDDVIDKIFNNNTGEHTTSDSNVFKPNFLDKSFVKSKSLNTDLNGNTENGIKRNEIEELKLETITLPSSGPQFCAAWKEFSDNQRFFYLQKIAENNLEIGKLLGAQLNSYMLSDIINIIHKYFISSDLPYIKLIYELSKNSELSVLAMFLEKNDKDKLSDLIKVLKIDNDMINMIHQIKENFCL